MRLVLCLLLVAGCAVDEVATDESALSLDTIHNCMLDCALQGVAWCGTMNEDGEVFRCQDACWEQPTVDACEASYRSYLECLRTSPPPVYVCHWEPPNAQTIPYPREPNRCDRQAVAWWWCELRN